MLSYSDLKDTFKTVSMAIMKGQEPSEEMVILLKYLREIGLDNAKILIDSIKHSMDKDAKDMPDGANLMSADSIKYLMEDMTPSFIQKMCREKSNDQSVSTDPWLYLL